MNTIPSISPVLPAVVVVGRAAELARRLLRSHPLLDAQPVLRLELLLIDSLHLEFGKKFLKGMKNVKTK
jgi:hypothetical protein